MPMRVGRGRRPHNHVDDDPPPDIELQCQLEGLVLEQDPLQAQQGEVWAGGAEHEIFTGADCQRGDRLGVSLIGACAMQFDLARDRAQGPHQTIGQVRAIADGQINQLRVLAGSHGRRPGLHDFDRGRTVVVRQGGRKDGRKSARAADEQHKGRSFYHRGQLPAVSVASIGLMTSPAPPWGSRFSPVQQ